VEVEVDVSGTPRITPHKVLISRRSLILCIPRQHALQTNAYALDIVYWAPSSLVQKIEADYTVGVDVGVNRYLMFSVLNEDDFRCFYRVGVAELELEPVRLTLVQRVIVEDLNIHVPLLQIDCGYKGNSWGNMFVEFDEFLLQSLRCE